MEKCGAKSTRSRNSRVAPVVVCWLPELNQIRFEAKTSNLFESASHQDFILRLLHRLTLCTLVNLPPCKTIEGSMRRLGEQADKEFAKLFALDTVVERDGKFAAPSIEHEWHTDGPEEFFTEYRCTRCGYISIALNDELKPALSTCWDWQMHCETRKLQTSSL